MALPLSSFKGNTNMIRKLILAVTATVALGTVTLVAMDDASARGFGGGGFHRGGGGGGGMRMGGGGFRHHGGGGFRHHGGGFRHHGGGHNRHWGHHRHWGHRGYGYRYGSYASYTPSYAAPVYAAPVYAAAAPAYSAPAYSAPSAPACYSCGGWTEDGGYMTYKKFINEQTGQPELRCVKVMDEPQQQTSSATIPYPGR
jgi:hypothetical protein